MISPQDEYVTIGKILKPIGLKGEVKVSPLTDNPGRFSQLRSKPILLRSKNAVSQSYTLENVREHGRYVFLSFQEIKTRFDASRYLNGEVQVPRSEVPPLPKDVHYHFDLMGLSVNLLDGRYIGEIEDILETRSNDVFVVRNRTQEYLIPALQSVVVKIDMTERRMIVRPVDGMVNLDAM